MNLTRGRQCYVVVGGEFSVSNDELSQRVHYEGGGRGAGEGHAHAACTGAKGFLTLSYLILTADLGAEKAGAGY